MKKILNILIAAFIVSQFAACDDGFEDMNVHPEQPTETTPDKLFTQVVKDMQVNGNFAMYLNAYHVYGYSQLAVNKGSDLNDYSARQGVDDAWKSYYNLLKNIRRLHQDLNAFEGETADKMKNRKAMVNILFAYATFEATDIFGDMPFTEAGYGNTQNFTPKYDTQESIYKECLTMLEDAVAMIDENDSDQYGFQVNASFVLADNKALAYKKFANLLRLKHGLRMYNADQATAKTHITEAMAGPLPENDSDDFGLFPHKFTDWKPGPFRWALIYTPTLRPGSYLESKMVTNVSTSYDIVDPRWKTICEGNKDGEYKVLPQSYDDHKDIKIETGGLYGGEWDNPFKPLSERAKNYSAFNRNYVMSWYEPHVFGSHAEARLCKAEAIAMGIVSGDAKVEYEAGIKSSINRMFNPSYTQDDNFKLDLPTEAAVNAMLAHPLVAYNAASPLEGIRTQRWIDYFQRPNEAWAVIRRTGSPSDRQDLKTDKGVLEMANRIIYPQDEVEYNNINYKAQVKVMGNDDLFTKVWWDK